jgi:glycosyltransferase involved in cell wall biosynthesis
VAHADPATLRLTIGVLTFRRPADLDEILPALAAQARAVASSQVDAGIVVVDNDPDGGARRQVETFAAASDVAVRYEHEPLAQISAARNRALDAAVEADVLVFIDDDERPTDPWLQELVSTFRREGTTAVVGPVRSTYEIEPSSWIAAGGYFVRRRPATGTRIDVAATNNLLLDMHEVRRLGLRFDPAFGTTGGEDMLFTKQLRKAGGTMVWCAEAMVVDVVPAARITRRWVVLRALSSGNSDSLTSVALAHTFGERMRVRGVALANGAVRVLGGALRALLGVVLRREAFRARGIRTGARGLGMILGAVGYRYQEYRRAS